MTGRVEQLDGGTMVFSLANGYSVRRLQLWGSGNLTLDVHGLAAESGRKVLDFLFLVPSASFHITSVCGPCPLGTFYDLIMVESRGGHASVQVDAIKGMNQNSALC